MSRHLVIAVHGIRTFGDWQDRLAQLLKQADPSVEIRTYKYGYFSALAFAMPFVRFLATRRFRASLASLVRSGAWDRIDIVAHSFGTHIVSWGLHGMPESERPQIHTIILAGSVLRPNFPWADLLGRWVRRVVNECGTRDAVLLLSQLIPLTGMAGRIGFHGMTGDPLVNRYHRFTHSDYFLEDGQPSDDFMRPRWLPLLLREEPIERIDQRGPLTAFHGVQIFLINNTEPIKLAAVAFLLALPIFYYRALYLETIVRLAESQVAQGETLAASHHYTEARERYAEARRNFLKARADPMPADIALYGAYRMQPPALQKMEVNFRPRDVLTVSEDGRTAFLSSQGSLGTWDLLSGTKSRHIGACDGEAAAMTIRQNLLIVGTVEGAVLACDTAVGGRLWRLTVGPAAVSALAVSAAQPFIAAGDARGNVRVIDATRGVEIESRQLHRTGVASLAFSPDGKRLLSASADAARLWTRGSSAEPAVLDRPGRYAATAFSRDGRVAIVATQSELSYWDAATARRLGSLSLPRGGGRPVLSRDGRYVVAAIRESKMVSAVDQERLGVMEVLGVPFIAGPDRFAVVADPLTSWTLPGYADRVHDAVFSADGETILLAKKGGTLEVWPLGRPIEPRRLAFGGPFRRPAFSSDGLLVLASDRGDAALWDASNLNRLQVFRHGSVVSSVAMVPSASTAAVGDGDGAITLWEVASGKQLRRIAAHQGEVSALAISPDGEELISIGADGAAYVWGLPDGGRRGQLADDKVQITGATYSPKGGIAALWTRDGRLVWLETKLGGRRDISSKQGMVFDAAFSPDGSQVLTAGHDGGIRLWTPFSQVPAVEAGSVNTRAGVAFLDKPGWAVVAGGWDRAIVIWDLMRGKDLARFPALPEGPAVIARGGPTRTMTSGAYAQNLIWNFTAGSELLEFEPRLERARAALRKNPADAVARNELGLWYAFRGRCAWASRMFESEGVVGVPSLHRFSCLAAAGRKQKALAELRRLREAKTVSPLYETLWQRALQAPVDKQMN